MSTGFNLNLFFVFHKNTSRFKRLRHLQKKNLVLTNLLSQSEYILPYDAPRLIDLSLFRHSLLLLKYFTRGFANESYSILLYTANIQVFPLVKYFSWKFDCSYSMGWYQGLYSNSKFIYSSIHKQGLSHLFCIPNKVDFFFLTSSQDYHSRRLQQEMNIKENFVCSLNNSFDNFNVDFYLFNSKFTYQIYYYLHILFISFRTTTKHYSSLFTKKTFLRPTAAASSSYYLRKKKTIQKSSSSLYHSIWSFKKTRSVWKIYKKIRGIPVRIPVTRNRIRKLSKSKNKKLIIALRAAHKNVIRASFRKTVLRKKKASQLQTKQLKKKIPPSLQTHKKTKKAKKSKKKKL